MNTKYLFTPNDEHLKFNKIYYDIFERKRKIAERKRKIINIKKLLLYKNI